jgi:thiol:disulfide interchange protein
VRDEVLREVAIVIVLLSTMSCGSGGATSPPVEVRLAPSPPALVSAATPPARADAPKLASAAIAWETSEIDARARAKKRGLPLLIFACAAWSAACHAMERDVFTDPHVLALAPRFVWLKIDLTDTEGDAELVAQRLGILGVPMTMVVDSDGTRLYAEPQFVAAERMAKDLAAAADRSRP